MNERILELAEKAFDLANEEIDVKCEGRTGMDGQLGIMYRTFAELIVRDVLDVCKKQKWNSGFNQYREGIRDTMESIKEHFGVEL